jgi:hypothetical protein
VKKRTELQLALSFEFALKGMKRDRDQAVGGKWNVKDVTGAECLATTDHWFSNLVSLMCSIIRTYHPHIIWEAK